MDVPAHHRFCALRDPDDQIDQVVIVVWPPYGQPADPEGGLRRGMTVAEAPGRHAARTHQPP